MICRGEAPSNQLMCVYAVCFRQSAIDDDDDDLTDLLLHFHKLKVASGPLCQQEFHRPVCRVPARLL